MMYVLSLLTVVAVGFLSLRGSHSKEIRLVLSTIIHRPASLVFEVIGTVERAPVWSRQPAWLPGPLRISIMSRWGDHTPTHQRAAGGTLKGPEEIWNRHMPDHEFAYRSVRRRDLSYESTFRLSPDDGKCRLTWEIRCRVYRLPDIVGRAAIAAAARESMANSLDYIRRLVLSGPESVRADTRIYEARRGHIPAA